MSRDANNVLMVPDWRNGNPYLNHLSNALESHGFRVEFADYPKGLMKLNNLASEHPKIRFIHIHWIPPLLAPIFWSPSKFRIKIKNLLLLLDCILCRIRGVRLVWTVHNLVSHESPNAEREVEARKLLFRGVSSVIVHSCEARKEIFRQYDLSDRRKKTSVIPHGNYIGDYPPNDERTREIKSKFSISEDNIALLFFGAIRQYKGLEWFIPTFQELKSGKYRLIIAGRVGDKALGEWVEKQSRNDPRILPCLDFVPEKDVAAYFAIADAVILPSRQTLTSGSALLAMSMGKALILPESARVFGTPGVKGAVYFDDDQDLLEKMANFSQEQLRAMGDHNLKIASELDWGKIGKSTTDVYAGNRVIWEYPK